MTKLIIVDTDVLIDAGRRIQDALTSLHHAAQDASLVISVITQLELFVGCRNQMELRKVEQFLTWFHIVRVNEPISDLATDLVRRYRLSHGLLIPDAFYCCNGPCSERAPAHEKSAGLSLHCWITPASLPVPVMNNTQ